MNMPLPELEHLLAVAAYLVVRHGDAYTPSFERMEQIVEEARNRDSTRDRASSVLAALMKRGVKDVSAA